MAHTFSRTIDLHQTLQQAIIGALLGIQTRIQEKKVQEDLVELVLVC